MAPAPPKKKQICYIIVSARSIVWLVLTMISTLLLMTALTGSEWLVAKHSIAVEVGNFTILKKPSFGLNSRCKKVSSGSFECGTFTLTTNSEIYPFFWKVSYLLMIIGFFLISVTFAFVLLSCCRQSLFGKSVHSVTGCLQVTSGIIAMLSTFIYPLGWNIERISSVCIDSSAFSPGECAVGYSLYASVAGILFSMCSGVFSLQAEKSSMSENVQRRLEDCGEHLVFVP